MAGKVHYRDGCVWRQRQHRPQRWPMPWGPSSSAAMNLHPRANIQKMAAGNPLNDEQGPWLETDPRCGSLGAKRAPASSSVSALKTVPRPDPRGNDSVSFLFLDGSQSLVLERMRARQGHFMRKAMVQNQFDTLERPDGEPACFASISTGPSNGWSTVPSPR